MADPVTATVVASSEAGGIAMGAGIAMAGSALATAWAQASIGSSIIGVLAEKPDQAMKLIVYMALPELIVLLGFVIAFLMLGKIETGAAAAGHV